MRTVLIHDIYFMMTLPCRIKGNPSLFNERKDLFYYICDDLILNVIVVERGDLKTKTINSMKYYNP